MIGTTIGKYRILDRLGEGGMGVVYLARDPELDRAVAIKVLSDRLNRDPLARRRLVREARSAAAIDHPYICKIYDVGTDGETAFIAMELVEGRTLRERLANGPLPIHEALRYATEMSEAMDKAQSKGFLHRDLKPSNVMVTPEGHVKIMDFGLARKAEASFVGDDEATMTMLTEAGEIVGTVAYMAPEQLRGETLDSRADLFSFGIILSEMLGGRHPFFRNTGVEIQAAILSEPASPLDESLVPTALVHLVDRLLSKNRESRPESFAELVEVLHALDSTSRSSRDRQPRWKPRHARTIVAAAAILGLVGVGFAVHSKLTAPTRYPLPKTTDADDLQDMKVGELETRARRLMENFGDLAQLEASIQVWEEIRQMDPEYVPALSGLATARSLVAWNADPGPDTLDRAQQEGEKALSLDPTSADAHLALGFVYTLRGLQDLAERMSKRSIELAPEDPWVLQARARFLMDHFGRFAEAERLARRATELAPQSVSSWFQLGWAQMEQGKYDQALRSFRESVALRPNFSAGHMGQGVVFMATDRYEEAMERFDETLRINPDSLQGRIFRSEALLHLGRFERAVADLRRIMVDHPQHALVRYAQVWLALGLIEGGEEGDGESLLESAEREFKAFPDLWVSDTGLAAVAAIRGQRGDAFRWLDKAIADGLSSNVMIRVDPALASLADDPRFASLLTTLRAGAETDAASAAP